MAVTAGALTKVSVGQTTASLSSAVAAGGSGPYTYQWYYSEDSGFTPDVDSIIDGATSLTLNMTGLKAGTQYYFAVVATDTGDSNATDESAELAVATSAAGQNQNQFAQTALLGMVDLPYNYNTISVQIDSSQVGNLVAGQAVKMYEAGDAGGIPKVVACTADNDEVLGFINYNIKNKSFSAGMACEISMAGNVMFLQATGAIARGRQVTLDITSIGGVAQAVGSSGDKIVGFSLDKVSGGQLVRVQLKTPSFTVA